MRRAVTEDGGATTKFMDATDFSDLRVVARQNGDQISPTS
jgi:hypothetical protein